MLTTFRHPCSAAHTAHHDLTRERACVLVLEDYH
jgi:hypothetical protein